MYRPRYSESFLICLMYLWASGGPVHAAIEGFVETFDGTGDYASVGGTFSGLDNPDWQIAGDGELVDGGYSFQNRSEPGGPTEGDVVSRPVIGQGSFVNRVEVKSPDLGDLTYNNSIDSSGAIYLHNNLNRDTRGRSAMFIGIAEDAADEGDHVDEWRLIYFVDNEGDSEWVPRGPHVALEIRYDHPTSMFTYFYDNDLGDEVPGMEIGPFHLAGSVADQHTPELRIHATGEAHGDGLLEFWSMLPISDLTGDFNGNGVLDATDIDQFSEQVRAGTSDLLYDLNADSVVDDADRQVWVHDLKQSYFGDADLNGTFDSTDLVQLLSFGEYEDEVAMNSTWLTGDCDGDGEFTSGDLVVALADGGYEAGPRAAVVAEPVGHVLALVGLMTLFSWRRAISSSLE
jgi:hypothetical protein